VISKTMADVFSAESIEFIKLQPFINELERSPLSKGCDINKILFRLLDGGLKLHFNEPGYLFDGVEISNGDVKCALIRGGFQQIIKTESGNEIELGHVFIERDNVRQLYSEMGFDTYPWPGDEIEKSIKKSVCEPVNSKAIKRENNFNACLLETIKEFTEANDHPPTVDAVIQRLKHKPPHGYTVTFNKDDTLSIDGATPKPIKNLKRTITNLLK